MLILAWESVHDEYILNHLRKSLNIWLNFLLFWQTANSNYFRRGACPQNLFQHNDIKECYQSLSPASVTQIKLVYVSMCNGCMW